MRTEGHPTARIATQHAIARATQIAAARGESIAVERLTVLGERLDSAIFNVAVVGEFKRGKSTLINALLGRDVLPTGVLPLTSVATRVRFGEEPHARVAFLSGEQLTIPLDRLAEFVTESANPANRARVASVDVVVPSELLRAGVALMDTPGVGSTLAHNTEATLRQLPGVDAAIFVTGAEPPISESERGFLRAVREHSHKMFFVLNKADALTASELADVVRFTRDVIAEEIDRDADVTAVSARRSLRGGDRGLDSLRVSLSGFFANDLQRIGAVSIAAKTCDVLVQLRGGVEAERDSLALTAEEIASRRDRLASVRAEVDRSRAGIAALVKADVAAVTASIERDLAVWRAEETVSLAAAARGALAGPDAIAPAHLDAFVKAQLREDIESRRPSIEGAVADAWRGLSAQRAAEVDRVAARAVDACSQVLTLHLPHASAMERPIEESRFTYSFFEVPSLAESLLPDLAAVIPARSGAKLALRRLETKIPLLVDRHSGRMRHDLVSRVTGGADLLVREMDRHLESLTQGLGMALDRAMEHLDTAMSIRADATPALMRLAEELTDLFDGLGKVAAAPGEGDG